MLTTTILCDVCQDAIDEAARGVSVVLALIPEPGHAATIHAHVACADSLDLAAVADDLTIREPPAADVVDGSTLANPPPT